MFVSLKVMSLSLKNSVESKKRMPVCFFIWRKVRMAVRTYIIMFPVRAGLEASF